MSSEIDLLERAVPVIEASMRYANGLVDVWDHKDATVLDDVARVVDEVANVVDALWPSSPLRDAMIANCRAYGEYTRDNARSLRAAPHIWTNPAAYVETQHERAWRGRLEDLRRECAGLAASRRMVA